MHLMLLLLYDNPRSQQQQVSHAQRHLKPHCLLIIIILSAMCVLAHAPGCHNARHGQKRVNLYQTRAAALVGGCRHTLRLGAAVRQQMISASGCDVPPSIDCKKRESSSISHVMPEPRPRRSLDKCGSFAGSCSSLAGLRSLHEQAWPSSMHVKRRSRQCIVQSRHWLPCKRLSTTTKVHTC